MIYLTTPLPVFLVGAVFLALGSWCAGRRCERKRSENEAMRGWKLVDLAGESR